MTGAVRLDDLGFTLMHEHVFTLNSEMRLQYPWDEEAIVQLAIDTMVELRALGVQTIVDLTVFNLGRDVARVRRVAEASGINILAATGIYTLRDMPTYFRVRHLRDREFLADFFVQEIEQGVAATGIKPAVLKCVTDQFGLTEDVEAVLRATARAHRRTGVPISTHSLSATKTGLVQQRVFESEGVDLSQVVIGHVGDSTDLAYIEQLIANGSVVGLDRFGDDQVTTVAQRIEVLVELCRRGHANKIVLGHDTNIESDHTSRAMRAVNPKLRNWKHSYISTTVIPTLLGRGVPASDIDLMTVANPRTMLARRAPY